MQHNSKPEIFKFKNLKLSHTSFQPEIATKHKNLNLTETLKLKLLQDQNGKKSRTEIVRKLNKSSCY